MLVRQKSHDGGESDRWQIREKRRADHGRGGNDMYVSLCRKHYNEGRIGPYRVILTECEMLRGSLLLFRYDAAATCRTTVKSTIKMTKRILFFRIRFKNTRMSVIVDYCCEVSAFSLTLKKGRYLNSSQRSRRSLSAVASTPALSTALSCPARYFFRA